MRYLLVGNYGVSNAGDEILREYFLERFPEIEWKVLSACPQEGEFPRIPAGLRSFLSFGWLRTIRELRTSQGMVFGGGTLLTDTESVRACLLWFLHAFVASLSRKPILLAFQGIGPFRTRLGEWCARWVVARASFISTRDEESYFRVTRHPLRHADPSTSSGSLREKLPGHISVTLSSSKCEQPRDVLRRAQYDVAGRVEARGWKKSTEVVQSFDPSLALLSEKNHDSRIKNVLIYIPRFSTEEIMQKMAVLRTWQSKGTVRILSLQPLDEREKKVCVHLASRAGADILSATSLQTVASDIADAGLVITERFHGALAALSQGVPFLAIRQREGDKLEGLARRCGCPVADSARLDVELFEKTNWDEIARRLPVVREECLKLVKRGEEALRKALRKL